MANPEHLEIVKQGAAALERYLIEHLEEVPEHMEGWLRLEGADLRGADLREAAAFFDWTDLGNANLSGATLSGVNISRANLAHANLTQAAVPDIIFTDANLSGATDGEHPFSPVCDRYPDTEGVIFSDAAR